jgi:dTDP-L-rhamnose 4-epimerase
MIKNILITGGAGFIGSHLADELLAHGHRVRVLDNLEPQVHGKSATRPAYLARDVELVIGDVRDRDMVRHSLSGIDAVYHLAAAVGVGQSMYEIDRYVSVNNQGTAILLEALIKHPVQRLVTASSMSIYGEGLCITAGGEMAAPRQRGIQQLNARQWELRDDSGEVLIPVHTPESKPPAPSSVYAVSKYSQEQMCLAVGRAYRIPTVALRFFNAFGTRQALSNPYTGVLAIVASRLLNGRPPVIYEDGLQQRDFASVTDIARACRLALDPRTPADEVYNIGSGQQYTISEVVKRLAIALGRENIAPEVTGKYRAGDVRHCFADIGKARRLLGYEPQVTLEEGMRELACWLEDQIAVDRVPEAAEELSVRGLAL